MSFKRIISINPLRRKQENSIRLQVLVKRAYGTKNKKEVDHLCKLFHKQAKKKGNEAVFDHLNKLALLNWR